MCGGGGQGEEETVIQKHEKVHMCLLLFASNYTTAFKSSLLDRTEKERIESTFETSKTIRFVYINTGPAGHTHEKRFLFWFLLRNHVCDVNKYLSHVFFDVCVCVYVWMCVYVAFEWGLILDYVLMQEA